MTIDSERPSHSLRIKIFFGLSLPIALFFSFNNYREPIPFDSIILVLFCIFGALLAIPEALMILRLRRKKESKLVVILSCILGGIGIFILLELKKRGIFVWNELYFTVPYMVFAFITFSSCFIAESNHSVRIYYALDGLRYVRTALTVRE